MDQNQNMVCSNCGTSFPVGCTACPSCGFAPRAAVAPTQVLQAPVQTEAVQPALVQPAQVQATAVQPALVQQAPVQTEAVQSAIVQPAQQVVETTPVVTPAPLMNSEGQVISTFSNPTDALHIAPTADDALPKMPSVPPGDWNEVAFSMQQQQMQQQVQPVVQKQPMDKNKLILLVLIATSGLGLLLQLISLNGVLSILSLILEIVAV